VTIEIRSADPNEPGIRPLIDALDAYQLSLYPAESNHLDSLDELAAANVVFLCACSGQTAVGCGAAKVLEVPERYGEIKRLYVEPAYRGQGLSLRLMQELEAHLLGRDVHVARLETGVHQPEALGLYERMGYRKRAPFGDYVEDALSVFMEKQLGAC
jgi:putative acetyltransferase